MNQPKHQIEEEREKKRKRKRGVRRGYLIHSLNIQLIISQTKKKRGETDRQNAANSSDDDNQ